jgi:hypothetical protein
MTDAIFSMMDSINKVAEQGLRSGLDAGKAERQAEIDWLVDSVGTALEFIEGYEDIADGDGGPRPNKAMQAGNILREILSRLGK